MQVAAFSKPELGAPLLTQGHPCVSPLSVVTNTRSHYPPHPQPTYAHPCTCPHSNAQLGRTLGSGRHPGASSGQHSVTQPALWQRFVLDVMEVAGGGRLGDMVPAITIPDLLQRCEGEVWECETAVERCRQCLGDMVPATTIPDLLQRHEG